MDNSEWPEWLHLAWNKKCDEVGALQRVDINAPLPDLLEIVTLEGKHLVSWGDWIIRGVKGELYPCKPDIFAATYEKVPGEYEMGFAHRMEGDKPMAMPEPVKEPPFEAQGVILGRCRSGKTEPRFDQARRELAEGKSVREIAQNCGLSAHTVLAIRDGGTAAAGVAKDILWEQQLTVNNKGDNMAGQIEPNNNANATETKIVTVKELRRELDASLQKVKGLVRTREVALAVTKIQEGIMWLGMELKELGNPTPYPNSYDPSNAVVDKTADGLKL